MTDELYLLLSHSLKNKNYYSINDKNIIIRLIKYIGNYLDSFFKSFPLSNRI